MPIETDSDRAIFVEADDFGVTVSWAHVNGPTTFEAILDAEYVLLATELDPVGREGSAPAFVCRSMDIPEDADRGDIVTISGSHDDAMNREYCVVEIKPDGTGMTVVRLQETED